MPLFVPGYQPNPFKGARNVVHILTVHGWSAFDSAKIETSQSFADLAKTAVQEVLAELDMRGTLLRTTPLSGCGPFKDGTENTQTITERVKGCMEELSASGADEQLRRADAVFVVAHSQGAVVAVELIAELLKEELLQPHIPGVQHVCLLAICGVHHGTHDSAARVSTRDATKELALLREPTSTTFVTYERALERMLRMGVQVVAVASYCDRVVSAASALMDGVDHPNILRAIYCDRKYVSKETSGAEVAGKPPILVLLMIAALARNRGVATDLLRYCSVPPLSSQSWAALTEIASLAGTSVRQAKVTFTGSLLWSGALAVGSALAGAAHAYMSDPSILDNTKQAFQDSNAHSVAHQSSTVYKFGFKAMLTAVGEAESKTHTGDASDSRLRPPVYQPSFDLPITEEEWAAFPELMDRLLAMTGPRVKQLLRDLLYELDTLDIDEPRVIHELRHWNERRRLLQ